MQLKVKAGGIRRQLIAASCALLGAAEGRAQEAQTSDAGTAAAPGLTLDSALGYYQESGGRIRAIEPIVTVQQVQDNGDIWGLNLTFDSLSGSSPNGALTSNKPQTFATPSGASLKGVPQTYTTASGQSQTVNAPIYSVAAGTLPVDSNYKDQRLAGALSWNHSLSRLTSLTLGGKLSYEHDFISGSFSALVAHDFNQKNTTLSLGVNGEFDSLHPIGGAPAPGTDYALFQKTGAKTKQGAGVVLGLTQVMAPRWVSEFNLSADRFSGYLDDPYKIISVLDATGATTGYLYEKRPDSRLRRSAYLENRWGWERASVALSLRYMNDDWQVHSSTAQFRVRFWNSPKDRYLEPTVRWYQQSAAQFYAPWLSSSAAQLTYASADSRLAALSAWTYGLKYAVKYGDDSDASELSVRLELYRQTQADRLAAPPALQGLNLYPGLQALMLQIGWRY